MSLAVCMVLVALLLDGDAGGQKNAVVRVPLRLGHLKHTAS